MNPLLPVGTLADRITRNAICFLIGFSAVAGFAIALEVLTRILR